MNHHPIISENTSPAERAAAVYSREPCARSFREDLEAHLIHGFVVATPDAFAMARPVPRAADPDDIVDPTVNWPREECDAWLIYLLAGDLAVTLRWLPFDLPFIGWEKRNKLRFYGVQSALAKLGAAI